MTNRKEVALPLFLKNEKGGTQMVFDSEHMKVWKRLNLMPAHLFEVLHQDMQRSRFEHQRLKKFKESHPDALIEDLCRVAGGIGRTSAEDGLLRCMAQKELHDFMVNNWESLVMPFLPGSQLFTDVNANKNFGVSRIEADPLYRLWDLLDNMTAIQIGENDFKARGAVKNSQGLCIVLEYDFKAKNQRDADEIVHKYKKMMLSKGLRTVLAFWKEANLKGRPSFNCYLSEVMNHCVEGRKSYFNDEERKEFWGTIRALAATKFRLEWPAKKNVRRLPQDRSGNKTSSLEWIEQPLMQIHGGEKKTDEGCPVRLNCTVLTQKAADAKFFPAIFSNKTLQLHPSDIYFGVVIQTRASQTGGKEITYDWHFTFKIANVEGQAKTNPRAAKNLVRKKLGKFRDSELIENWREDRSSVHITPLSHKRNNR